MKLKIRTGIAALITIAVIAGVVVLATRADGREATRATSNDGGAWLVDRRSGGTAHVEYTTREPTVHTQIAEPGSALSARQSPGVTVVYDQTASVVSLIDSANAVEQGATIVPLGSQVNTLPGGVVVFDPQARSVWTAVAGEFGQVDSVDELTPTRLGDVSQVVVGRDGDLAIVTDASVAWPLTGQAPVPLPAALRAVDSLQTTMTGPQAVLVDGEQWVAVSDTAAREFDPGTLGPIAWLQQSSMSWPLVGAITAAGSLAIVDVSTGEAVEVGTVDISPTNRPILHDGCLHVLGVTTTDEVEFAAFCLDGNNVIERNLGVNVEAELRLVNGRVWIDGLDGTGYLITPELEIEEIADFSAVFDEAEGDDDADGDEVQQEIDQSVADAELIQADEGDNDDENSPPVAEDDRVATRLGRPLIVDVLGNDTDPDGDVVLISQVELTSGNGRVEIAAGGTEIQVTATEGLGQIGFRYRITDGYVNSFDDADVVVDVLPESQAGNRPPTPQLDRLTGAAGTVVAANLLANDTDPDGDAVILRSIDGETGVSVLNTHPNGDVLLVLPSRVVEGIIEVPYLVEDEWRATTEGILQVTVRLDGSNTPPDARNDAGATQVGRRITLDLLANDVDGDNDVLSIGQSATPLGPRDIGFVSTADDGQFTFEPTRAGTFLFEYSVTDRSEADRAQIRVEVTERAQNRPPIALRDDVVLALGETRLVRTFDNDGDLDGDLFGVIDQTSNDRLDILLEQGVGFFVTLKAGAGAIETFDYRLSDGQAESELATVVVARSDLSFQDSPPVAVDDVARVRPGRISVIPVLRNDFDPEGGPLEITAVEASDEVATTVGPLGQWIETDVPADAELPFAALYTVTDEAGNVGAGTVQVAIVPPDEPNSPPIARPDTAYTIENLAITIPVLANDFDPQSDPISLTGSVPSSPVGGTLELSEDETGFRYAPNPGFLGTDRFTYVVRDSEGAESIGFVDIGVMPTPQTNTAPVANPDLEFVFTAGAGEVTLDVLANDIDFDGDRLRVIDVRGGGAISSTGDAVTYVLPERSPEQQVVGLSYEISDGRGGTDDTEVNITILPNIDPVPPVAEPDAVGPVRAGEVVEVDVLANDSDPDGQVADLVVTVSDPEVTVVGPILVFTAPDESRDFSYTITDVDGLTASSFVTVTVEPNLAPEIEQPIFLGEFFTDDEVPPVDLSQFVTDPDGDALVFSNISGQIGGTTRLDQDSADARVVFFSPDADFRGDAGFAFSVDDGNGHEATGRVSLTLLGRSNRPPFANNAAVTIEAGVPQPLSLAALFEDPDDDDVLSYLVTADVDEPLRSEALDAETVTLSAPITAGDSESLMRVVATDRQGETAEAEVSVTLTPSSIGPPVTSPDVAETNQGVEIAVEVLSNDIDTLGEGDLKILNTFVAAAAGSTTHSVDTITYTPEPNFFGTTTIQYQIVDARNREDGEAEGLLTVEVIGRPDAPAGVTAEAIGPRDITLTWLPPANNGAEIEGYRIRVNNSELVDVDSASPSYLFDDRVPGEGYRFEVLAFNKAGDGEYSAQTLEVIPDEVPGPPGKPSIAFTSNPGELAVAWSEPANEGSSIQEYDLEISGCRSEVRQVVALDYVWSGLNNGERCAFTVTAVNQAVLRGGTPLPSPSSDLECPVDIPGAPAAPTVVRGDKQAQATWSQPANPDCEELIRYELVRLRAGGNDGSTFVPFGTVTDTSAPLENGTSYEFQIRAENRAGWGPLSPVSAAVIPCGVPLAPGAPSVVRGDLLVTVTDSVAAPENGCFVSQYEIRINGSDVRSWGASGGSTATGDVTGLTNGTPYTLEFRGINEIGTGAWGTPTSPVTPAGLPIGGAITASVSGDLYTWEISGADGNGDNITSYIMSGDVSGFASSPSSGSGNCLNNLGNQCEATNSTIEVWGGCDQNAQTVSVSGRAVNPVGQGPLLSQTITLEGCPDAPTHTTSATPGFYTVDWNSPPGADEFWTQQSPGPTIGPLTTNSAQYAATPGASFEVQVWACNEFGCLPSGFTTVDIPNPTVSIGLGTSSTGNCWNRPSITASGGIPEQGCYNINITLSGFVGVHTVRCFSTMNYGQWLEFDSFTAGNGNYDACSYSQAGRHVGVVVDGDITGDPNESMWVTYPAVGSNVWGNWPTN